jgi:hypothetical protein
VNVVVIAGTADGEQLRQEGVAGNVAVTRARQDGRTRLRRDARAVTVGFARSRTLTWSTWAHEEGTPLKIMARVMGHTKVDTTINTYAQVLEESVRAAVATVDEKLFKVVQSRTRASALIH